MPFNDNSLGKSLTNVFAKTKRKDTVGRGSIDVDINMLLPPKQNPRQVFDEEALEELATSIQQHGLLQPIVVMNKDGGYEIIAGERRYRACKKAGLQRIPVVIRDSLSKQELAEMRLIENIQRENLNPVELAEAYQVLMDQHELTQELVAERVGKKRSSIANSLRLLQLPEQVRKLLTENKLSMGHAKCLGGLPDDQAVSLATKAVKENLSVRDVEKYAKNGEWENTSGLVAPASAKGKKSKPPHIRELEDNLKRLFDADVAVKESKGKGSVTIKFHSKGHFKEVLEELTKAFESARHENS